MIDVTKVLTKIIDATCLDKLKYDKSFIEEAVGMSGRDLSNCPDSIVSGYVFELSTYIVHLQIVLNTYKVKYNDTVTRYELKKAEVLATLSAPSKATVKEKEQLALSNSAELKELEEQVRASKALFTIFECVPDRYVEISNALKKELSIRYSKGVR